MTKRDMVIAGAAHRSAGLQLTPRDCQLIDAQIFAASKSSERPARFYATMRGEFNKAWQARHWEMVGGRDGQR